MTIKNLNEQRLKKKQTKDQKLAKIIVDDLETVVKTLNLTIDALGYFRKYTAVMEIISSIQTNKTLIEIKLKKYRKEAGIEEDKMETT